MARDWEPRNRKTYTLHRTVSARAAPSAYGISPQRGDEMLEVKWISVLVPPLWGKGGAKNQKGHARREKDYVGIAKDA